MSYTTKDYIVKDLKIESLMGGPIEFKAPWLESFNKEYEEEYKKALERKKYDEVWELIKKKNNW